MIRQHCGRGRSRTLLGRRPAVRRKSRNATVRDIADAGIGMAPVSALNLFQWNRVAVILAPFFAVVIVAELIVTHVRRRIP